MPFRLEEANKGINVAGLICIYHKVIVWTMILVTVLAGNKVAEINVNIMVREVLSYTLKEILNIRPFEAWKIVFSTMRKITFVVCGCEEKCTTTSLLTIQPFRV